MRKWDKINLVTVLIAAFAGFASGQYFGMVGWLICAVTIVGYSVWDKEKCTFPKCHLRKHDERTSI